MGTNNGNYSLSTYAPKIPAIYVISVVGYLWSHVSDRAISIKGNRFFGRVLRFFMINREIIFGASKISLDQKEPKVFCQILNFSFELSNSLLKIERKNCGHRYSFGVEIFKVSSWTHCKWCRFRFDSGECIPYFHMYINVVGIMSSVDVLSAVSGSSMSHSLYISVRLMVCQWLCVFVCACVCL